MTQDFPVATDVEQEIQNLDRNVNEYSEAPSNRRSQERIDYHDVGENDGCETFDQNAPYGNIDVDNINLQIQSPQEHNLMQGENFYGNINNQQDNPERVSNYYGNVEPRTSENGKQEIYENMVGASEGTGQFDPDQTDNMPSFMAPSPPIEDNPQVPI